MLVITGTQGKQHDGAEIASLPLCQLADRLDD
jgi:hypothetical protein